MSQETYPPSPVLVGAKAIVEYGDKILLLRQAEGGRWDLPGGARDFGEVPSESVIREVKEETGLDCAPGRMIASAQAMETLKWWHNEEHEILTFCYVMRAYSDQVTLSGEHIEHRWVNIWDALEQKLIPEDDKKYIFLKEYYRRKKRSKKIGQTVNTIDARAKTVYNG